MLENDTPFFQVIAFDADDTLWHNERLYQQTETNFVEILSTYISPEKQRTACTKWKPAIWGNLATGSNHLLFR